MPRAHRNADGRPVKVAVAFAKRENQERDFAGLMLITSTIRATSSLSVGMRRRLRRTSTVSAVEAPMRIEDYGLVGNTITSALISRAGSIDWLCLPRFDGSACFAALLGSSRNGSWKIAPAEDGHTVTRAYRKDTAILETTFECKGGAFTVIDFMPPPETQQDR